MSEVNFKNISEKQGRLRRAGVTAQMVGTWRLPQPAQGVYLKLFLSPSMKHEDVILGASVLSGVLYLTLPLLYLY